MSTFKIKGGLSRHPTPTPMIPV